MKLRDIQAKFVNCVYQGESSKTLEEIITPAGSLKKQESMEVYTDDYEVRMLEALKENYEKVFERVGAETFYMLYKDFKDCFTSHSYDLGRYGDEFPEFLKNHSINNRCPHLHTLAEMDLAFREIFHSTFEKGISASKFSNANESSVFEFLGNLHAFNAPIPLWKPDYANELSFFLFRTEECVNYFPISKNQYSLFMNLRELIPLAKAIEKTKEITSEEIQQLFTFLSVNRLIKSLK